MEIKSEVVARMPTAPTKLTVKMVRKYLADLPDNAGRVATINAESDAVVTLSPDAGCDTLRFTRTVFTAEQEHFTYVSTIGNGWYVRAATPDERALLP